MRRGRSRLARRWRLRGRSGTAVFWLSAAGLAAVTGMAVQSAVGKADARAAHYGNELRVPVTRRAVVAGAALRAADIDYRNVPEAFVPSGPVDDAPVGHTALIDMAPGEVILRSKVAPAGLRGVAALLGPDERALAIPVGDSQPALRVGDRVDVLATDRQTGATDVAARGARVVGVDDKTITLALRPGDVAPVAAALAADAVTLALGTP